MSKYNKVEAVAVVSNLTSGGAVVYKENIIRCLRHKYRVQIYSPEPYVENGKNKITNTLKYLKYCVIYLNKFYKNLAFKLNKKKIKKVIIFQDSYIKTPNIFKFLKHKTVYIFHEPPREFYENMKLHTENIYQIIFNILFRLPIMFIDRMNMASVETIVSNSIYSKGLLQKIYGKESIVIYPGFSKIKLKKNIRRLKNCITVGSLMRYKGHDMVIKSIGKININKPTLTIIGNGSLKRKKLLRELAKKHDVRLTILSSLSDTELSNKYRESQTYINAAQGEPFGLTSLEAIGYGCNLVTNDSGGTKELKNFFKKSVYISKNNTNDLAKKISKSLINKVSQKVDTRYFHWRKVTSRIDKI